jgi:hypothetical protein
MNNCHGKSLIEVSMAKMFQKYFFDVAKTDEIWQ